MREGHRHAGTTLPPSHPGDVSLSVRQYRHHTQYYSLSCSQAESKRRSGRGTATIWSASFLSPKVLQRCRVSPSRRIPILVVSQELENLCVCPPSRVHHFPSPVWRKAQRILRIPLNTKEGDVVLVSRAAEDKSVGPRLRQQPLTKHRVLDAPERDLLQEFPPRACQGSFLRSSLSPGEVEPPIIASVHTIAQVLPAQDDLGGIRSRHHVPLCLVLSVGTPPSIHTSPHRRRHLTTVRGGLLQ